MVRYEEVSAITDVAGYPPKISSVFLLLHVEVSDLEI